MAAAAIIKLGVNAQKLAQFVNDKGYVNLVLWVNEEPDQYNNNVSAQISKAKDSTEPTVYVGNGKVTRVNGEVKAIEYQPANELGTQQQSMAGREVEDSFPF